jgi:hypothetical protein
MPHLNRQNAACLSFKFIDMLSIELLLLGVIPDSLSTISILSCEIPIDILIKEYRNCLLVVLS